MPAQSIYFPHKDELNSMIAHAEAQGLSFSQWAVHCMRTVLKNQQDIEALVDTPKHKSIRSCIPVRPFRNG